MQPKGRPTQPPEQRECSRKKSNGAPKHGVCSCEESKKKRWKKPTWFNHPAQVLSCRICKLPISSDSEVERPAATAAKLGFRPNHNHGSGPVVNSSDLGAVGVGGLPSDVDCVMNSVNRGLEELGFKHRLSKDELCKAQTQLQQENPKANSESYGEPSKSFTIPVVAKALRGLLPEHNITLKNLCKKGRDVKQILSQIASAFKKPQRQRKKMLYLVDGVLNSSWFVGDMDGDRAVEADDCKNDPADWRHMVLLSEEGNAMFDFQGGETVEHRAVDLSRKGSEYPTLCDRGGRIRGRDEHLGAPYLVWIHKIHLFDVERK